MKESRLFKIIYHLLDKGHTTAPELAKKFEVSVRTIYRDIDALSDAGIPVYAEAGRNGGIRFLHGFVLDKAVLSKEEKQEILTALQSINIAQNISSSQTLQKLSAIFQLGSDYKQIKIHYASSYKSISERIVEPYKLLYKAKAWYLLAFCTEKQDWRTFKLNRILDLEMMEEGFLRRNLPGFPEEVAYRIYDDFDETQIQRQENGDLIVSAKMPEDQWLIGFLLSFGSQVEILSPVYLRNIVAEQAKLIYEKNKT